jgi:integrase
LPSHIFELLKPIWIEKRETSNRVRGRIETIIAKNVDIDDNEFRNPAELTKQLREKLPKRPKLSPVITPPCPTPKYRNSCLSWPAPMAAAQALRFLIFTVCRTNEVLGARWTEIDRPRAIWKIPGERMKMDEDHSVPLSDPALAILGKMRDGSQSELIFPSVGDEPHLRTNTRTRRLPLINAEPSSRSGAPS